MDIATLVGLIGALAMILLAMFLGGDIMLFVNAPSLLIVIGGTTFAVMMMFPLGDTLASFKVMLKAFLSKPDKAEELIEKGVELATIARKEGILGLEGQEIPNEFLQKGISLCVDGHEPDFVQRMLSKDINLSIERHEKGQKFFTKIGEIGPAMGMIGTLIGLVSMLANMDDPKTIGPAMAVALLTTLYGAMLANAFAIPVTEKLAYRAEEERLNKQLILETIGAIQEGINPKVMAELLRTYLPESKRALEAEE